MLGLRVVITFAEESPAKSGKCFKCYLKRYLLICDWSV